MNRTGKRTLRISLGKLILLMTVICGFLAAYSLSYKFNYWDGYYAEMVGQVDFQGTKCDVFVILEDGKKTPTIRQRLLIYRMQNYKASLAASINDAANENRIEYEKLVGDLTEEYGLPVMNRHNIQDHFRFGLIWIPRLEGSDDDFIVLGCGCNWEEEHGMQLLIKNGKSVEWHGSDGPWQWEKPWEFVAKRSK